MNYLIEDKEKFLEMQQAWKDHINSGGEISAEDHIMYNAIRGYPLDRGFTTTTKQAKLDSGHRTAFDLSSERLKFQINLNKFRPTWNYFKFGLTTEEMADLCIRIFS